MVPRHLHVAVVSIVCTLNPLSPPAIELVLTPLAVQAIREGKMPESMQLVARLNAEAGGKVSVFDRLASTTTESRRQKVNDRDQLHENLRCAEPKRICRVHVTIVTKCLPLPPRE